MIIQTPVAHDTHGHEWTDPNGTDEWRSDSQGTTWTLEQLNRFFGPIAITEPSPLTLAEITAELQRLNRILTSLKTRSYR